MLYTCESKTNESKLGVKPRKKSKTDKLINQSENQKLKRCEERRQYIKRINIQIQEKPRRL